MHKHAQTISCAGIIRAWHSDAMLLLLVMSRSVGPQYGSTMNHSVKVELELELGGVVLVRVY